MYVSRACVGLMLFVMILCDSLKKKARRVLLRQASHAIITDCVRLKLQTICCNSTTGFLTPSQCLCNCVGL